MAIGAEGDRGWEGTGVEGRRCSECRGAGIVWAEDCDGGGGEGGESGGGGGGWVGWRRSREGAW